MVRKTPEPMGGGYDVKDGQGDVTDGKRCEDKQVHAHSDKDGWASERIRTSGRTNHTRIVSIPGSMLSLLARLLRRPFLPPPCWLQPMSINAGARGGRFVTCTLRTLYQASSRAAIFPVSPFLDGSCSSGPFA